jgi:hypothetical protein
METVNWEAAGAIGEIVGAAAVVVSLVYLASQIRTQNREARAASVHQVMHEYSNSISRLHEPAMADLWVAAIEDFGSLSSSERLRFVVYLTAAVRSFIWNRLGSVRNTLRRFGAPSGLVAGTTSPPASRVPAELPVPAG